MTERRYGHDRNFREAWRNKIHGTAARLASVPVFRSLSLYAAVAILGTAFFFFLHYLGNQLPRDLARQRFATEFNSNQVDRGYARNLKSRFESCYIGSAIIAGSRKADSESTLADAVILKNFVRKSPQDFCPELKEAASSAAPNLNEAHLATRHWWGSKALFAIALYALSLHEIRELIITATYLASGLLAVSLLLVSPKMFLVATPLVIFGVFLSSVRDWADIANGLPYLWAILSTAILAFLMRGRAARQTSLGRVRLFCFMTGMVSSFLWMKIGHAWVRFRQRGFDDLTMLGEGLRARGYEWMLLSHCHERLTEDGRWTVV